MDIPYQAIAHHEYISEHADDLNFDAGQQIRVTGIEDSEWLSGEYTDSSGSIKYGIFPKTFVEPVKLDDSPIVSLSLRDSVDPDTRDTTRSTIPHQPPQSLTSAEDLSRNSSSGPRASQPILDLPYDPRTLQRQSLDVPLPASNSSPLAVESPGEKEDTGQKVAESRISQEEATTSPLQAENIGELGPQLDSRSLLASESKPVQTNSFKDRIAAFNKKDAGPIAPKTLPKPSLAKKPFIAAPPSKSAFIPIARKMSSSTTKASNQSDFLPSSTQSPVEETNRSSIIGMSQPQVSSLKDRIALLQAERHPMKIKTLPADQQDSASNPLKHPHEEADHAASPVVQFDRPSLIVRTKTNQSIDTTSPRDSLQYDESLDTDRNNTYHDPTAKSIVLHPPTTIDTDHGTGEDQAESNIIAPVSDVLEEEQDRKEQLRQRMAKMSGMGMGMHMALGMSPASSMKPKITQRQTLHNDIDIQKASAHKNISRDELIPVPTSGQLHDSLESRTDAYHVAEGADGIPPDKHQSNLSTISSMPTADHSSTTVLSSEEIEEYSFDNGAQPKQDSSEDRESLSEITSIVDDTIPDSTPLPSQRPQVPPLSFHTLLSEEPISIPRIPNRPQRFKASDLTSVVDQPDVTKCSVPKITAQSSEESSFTTQPSVPILSEERQDVSVSESQDKLPLSGSAYDVPETRQPPYPVEATSPRINRPPPPVPVSHSQRDSDSRSRDLASQVSSYPNTPLSAPPVPPGNIPSSPSELTSDISDVAWDDESTATKKYQEENLSMSKSGSLPSRPTSGQVHIAQDHRRDARTSSESHRGHENSAAQRDGHRRNSHGTYLARDIELTLPQNWWTLSNVPPLALHGRNDLIFEMDENSSTRRGGRTYMSRDIYVLYEDYSSSVISAQYYVGEPQHVSFQQNHEQPPAAPSQALLEQEYSRFGSSIIAFVSKRAGQTIGDGSAISLVRETLSRDPHALPSPSIRSHGFSVYTNIGNASVVSVDEIRPGDILTFRNAKLTGHKGAIKTKYNIDVGKPDHCKHPLLSQQKLNYTGAIISEWDGTKKKLKCYEQGRESRKVVQSSYKLGDLKSGEIRVWRVLSRSYVGWDNA